MTHSTHTSVSGRAKLSLLTLALMATPFAMAQDAGWYLGGNIGQSTATIDEARITSGLLGSGLVAGPSTTQTTTWASRSLAATSTTSIFRSRRVILTLGSLALPPPPPLPAP